MNEIIMAWPQLIKNYKHKLFPFFAHFCLNNWICSQSHSFLANIIFGINPLLLGTILVIFVLIYFRIYEIRLSTNTL